MTCYPEAQKKAQEELDRVVGTDRLPTFADRDDLPYVEALVTEVFRWNPVAPLGADYNCFVLSDCFEAGLQVYLTVSWRMISMVDTLFRRAAS